MGYDFAVAYKDPNIAKQWCSTLKKQGEIVVCEGCWDCFRGPKCEPLTGMDYYGKWAGSVIGLVSDKRDSEQKYIVERRSILGWYSKDEVNRMIKRLEPIYRKLWIEDTYDIPEGDYDFYRENIPEIELLSFKGLRVTMDEQINRLKLRRERTDSDSDSDDWSWNDFWKTTEVLRLLYHCSDNGCGLYAS